ncbi:enoyl-CoA hydratase [Caryophanon tenue]|uniref:Enoyl-CoA hydratase n=2 Tax=Caryophanon tenue TaxID=33978 RepID=A0A1C0YD23_9BACL|nr:enoyl-CoA hydratase [Caryophanon tenue]
MRTASANALSVHLLDELSQLLTTVATHDDIYVVVLTGDGEKAFCAGADLKERQTMNDTQVKQTVAKIGALMTQIEQLPQPVIAAINGVAFGGGLEMALASDIRVAAKHSKLGLTESSLGIIPGAGGTQRLPRLIGIARAKELMYTARRISADEAYAYGIVEYVVPYAELQVFTQQLAQEMARNAPLSLRQIKLAVNQGMQTDLTTGLAIETLAYSRTLYSEDRLEGLAAFQEKRAPHYKGR